MTVRWAPGTRGRSVRRAAVLLTGPTLLLLAAILLGTRDPFFAGIRCVLFAAIGLVWLSWRGSRAARDRIETDSAVRRSRLVGGTAVVLGAVLVGAVAGSLLAPPAASRFVVRDEVTPRSTRSSTRVRWPGSARIRSSSRRPDSSRSRGSSRAN
ncbi:hypothetical protein ACRAWC_15305 [Leifsonia sp. L25]|uniref:hypothetical protein n=1 Tax=Leifsonia sp. L25 TaxID=3423957 RepID=UPI003D685B63